MSDSFWRLKIKCLNCGEITEKADGFSTDDWTEVFVFSGYSINSSSNDKNTFSNSFTCTFCGSKNDIDELYWNKNVCVESIDEIEDYLERNLETVIERNGLYDHLWNPDLQTAIKRYMILYTNRDRLKRIYYDYYDALNNPKLLLKFEPVYGTLVVGSEMIRNKKLLRKVYLPNTVMEIKEETFSQCEKLRDVFIPNAVKVLGAGTFCGCTSLESVHLPEKIKIIPRNLFADCRNLKKCYLSDDIVEIGSRAFSGCVSMERLWIPKSLAKIGDYAFYNCVSVKEIEIPRTVVEIGEYAFENCPELIIKCHANSVAELYAKENEIKYITI